MKVSMIFLYVWLKKYTAIFELFVKEGGMSENNLSLGHHSAVIQELIVVLYVSRAPLRRQYTVMFVTSEHPSAQPAPYSKISISER